MGRQRWYEAEGATAWTGREGDRRSVKYFIGFAQNTWEAMCRHGRHWCMFVYVFATCWDHVNGGVGLRNDMTVSPRYDSRYDDDGLTAAFWLDETLCARFRWVSTMLRYD